MTDLTKIEKPFGLLDKETQDALWEHKGIIERFIGTSWVDKEGGLFYGTFTYRAKAAKPAKLPEWPAGLRPEWKWIAMDGDGGVCVHQDKPEKTRGMWSSNKNQYRIDHMVNISFDGIPWREAVIQRPEGV
jgi:hypothetical protein